MMCLVGGHVLSVLKLAIVVPLYGGKYLSLEGKCVPLATQLSQLRFRYANLSCRWHV
jgi:hypothetical protein